jgi:hypothetical protein
MMQRRTFVTGMGDPRRLATGDQFIVRGVRRAHDLLDHLIRAL